MGELIKVKDTHTEQERAFLDSLNSCEERYEKHEITPSVASDVLEVCNTRNRAIKKPQLAKITGSIKNGFWDHNGETICFSNHGVLIDGQHRLLACVNANKPIVSTISFGISSERAFETHGQAVQRSAAQVLAMHGFKNSKSLASSIKHMILYNSAAGMGWSGDDIQRIKLIHQTIGRDDISDVALSIEDDVLSMSSALDSSIPRNLNRSVICAMFIRLARINKELADKFFDRLSSGLFLSVDDPVYLLRRVMENTRFQAKKFRNSLEGRYTTSCYIVLAWNMCITGERKSCLSHDRRNETPQPLIPTSEQLKALGIGVR